MKPLQKNQDIRMRIHLQRMKPRFFYKKKIKRFELGLDYNFLIKCQFKLTPKSHDN